MQLIVLVTFQILGAYTQTATLGLADGFLTFNTPSFSVQLVKDSQTLYSLKPGDGSSTFDFIPADKMSQRQYNGNVHLGDLSFRARVLGSVTWLSGDTYTSRKPVMPLPVSGITLAASNLSPTIPSNSLLNITRRWVAHDGILELLFDVTNSLESSVEIGALGASLEFNNVGSMTHSCWLSLIVTKRFSQIVQRRRQMNCAVSSIHI